MKIIEQYDLKGKVAIITGAGDGIGKASALKLAEAGVDVVCSDLDIEKARETAKEAAVLGVKALAVKCNVTIEEDLKNLVDETIKNFKKVNILVNNAGGGGGGREKLEELTLDYITFIYKLNVFSNFYFNETLCPTYEKRQLWVNNKYKFNGK